MKKSAQEKLLEAIRNHNEAQECEDDKVNLQDVIVEFGNMDNEQLEKSVKKLNDDLETRNEG